MKMLRSTTVANAEQQHSTTCVGLSESLEYAEPAVPWPDSRARFPEPTRRAMGLTMARRDNPRRVARRAHAHGQSRQLLLMNFFAWYRSEDNVKQPQGDRRFDK